MASDRVLTPPDAKNSVYEKDIKGVIVKDITDKIIAIFYVIINWENLIWKLIHIKTWELIFKFEFL